MDKDVVRKWIGRSLEQFFDCYLPIIEGKSAYSEEQLIERLRAIAEEAELRLKNPNFPSNE